MTTDVKSPFWAIQSDIYGVYGVLQNPKEVDHSYNFLDGNKIDTKLIPQFNDLVFEVGHPGGEADEEPEGILGNSMPLMRKDFLEALQASGVTNIQTWPAVLLNKEANRRWDNYFLYKIIGRIIHPSTLGDEIMPGAGGDSGLFDLDVTQIVLNKEKIPDLSLFMLAESPLFFICDNQVMETLKRNRPSTGWRISVSEIRIQ